MRAYMSKGKPAQRGPLLHDDDFTIIAKYRSEYAGPSSTTCWPRMCSAWAACTGSWRPRCSRPWRASTARRSEDGREVQDGHRHPRRAAQVPATGHRARDRAGSHWSPASAGYPFGECAQPPHRPAARHGQRQANELITGSSPGAGSARARRAWRSTTSASSQTSTSQDDGRNPWMDSMAKRRRKTLVICRRCHEDIHAGRATKPYPK